MAYEGELVKMENGRWARFKRCRIQNAGHPDPDDTSILVAVELEEQYQELLNQAEHTFAAQARISLPSRASAELESVGPALH